MGVPSIKQDAGMQKAAKKKLRPMKILSDFEKEVKDIEEMEKWKKSGKK